MAIPYASRTAAEGVVPITGTDGTIDDAFVPSSASNPAMNGTASAGTATSYARTDHVHPSDTSRVATSVTVNGHALTGNVTVTAADIGLGSVENTAISTWTGSSHIATVGIITTGTWHGTAIAQAYIADAAVSLAKMSNLAANSIIGNNTESAATPVALTATQVKTLLAIAQADVSGLTTASSPTFAGLTLTPASTSTIPLSSQSLQSTAPLGLELVTNGGFTTGDLTGWTGANWSYSSGTALHTAGATTALSQSITVTNGAQYQVEITIAGRTAGSVAVSVGAVYIYDNGTATTLTANTTYQRSLVAAGTTGLQTLAVTPTTDFDGTVDAITVKQITGVSQVAQQWLGSSGLVFAEIRGSGVLYNSFFGTDAGRSNTTGSYNTFAGMYAGYANTTGSNNTFAGYQAGYANTTGSYNTFAGMNAGYANTTGSYNTFAGYQAGRYQADGTSALSTAATSTYIGYACRGYSNSDSNSIVIGSNAIGIGANTTVVGNSSTTLSLIWGSVGAGIAPVLSGSGAGLHVAGDMIRIGTSKTPASAGATGNAGEIAWDADYIYVCVATNTWKRSAIATW